MDSDNRQSRRVQILIEVSCEGVGQQTQTRISDISRSGVFVDSISPIMEGSPINMSFVLPGGHRVEAKGLVTHSQPGIGMGIAFVDLKPEDSELIGKLVDEAS